MGEQLVQGCYAVTRMGFKHATIWEQGTKLTTEPLNHHDNEDNEENDDDDDDDDNDAK